MARQSYAARIKIRIAELEQIIAQAQAELKEMRIAEKVINKLGGDDDDEETPALAKGQTVGGAIIEVLKLYGPMESQEIFRRVNEKMTTTYNTISTTLTRLKQRSLIALDGRVWSALDVVEAPADASPQGASNEEDGGGATPDVFD